MPKCSIAHRRLGVKVIEELGERGILIIFYLMRKGKEIVKISDLKQDLHMGSAALYATIERLRGLGLVKTRRIGVVRAVELTEDGLKFAEKLKELDDLLREIARKRAQ